MKFCPKCQTRYTDASLQFCLQDGTPLALTTDSDAPPTVAFDEPETIVRPRENEPLRFDLPDQNRQTSERNYTTNATNFQPAPKKSNTLLAVLLTIVGMLLVFGIIGGGAWIYFKNRQTEIAANTVSGANNQNSASNANDKSNVNKSPTPTVSPKTNANNENTAPNTAKTPLSTADKTKITTDVSSRIDSWESDGESLDISSYMDNYAPTIDYYNKKGATRAQVQSDKEKAFDVYDSINIKVTNLTVTPDESGETATAIFDKEWTFEGDEKYSAGKVRQQLQLKKINNKWLITAEKDLKLYYKE